MTRRFYINQMGPRPIVRRNLQVRLMNRGDPIELERIYNLEARALVEQFYMKCRQQADLNGLNFQVQRYRTPVASMTYRRNYGDETMDVLLSDSVVSGYTELPKPDLMYVSAEWTSGAHDAMMLLAIRGVNTASAPSIYDGRVDEATYEQPLGEARIYPNLVSGYLRTYEDEFRYGTRRFAAGNISRPNFDAGSGEPAPPGNFSTGVLVDLKYLRETHGIRDIDMRAVVQVVTGEYAPGPCLRYHFSANYEVQSGIYAGQVWTIVLTDPDLACDGPTSSPELLSSIRSYSGTPSPFLNADGENTGVPTDIGASFWGPDGHNITRVSDFVMVGTTPQWYEPVDTPLQYNLRIRTYMMPDLKFVDVGTPGADTVGVARLFNQDPLTWLETAGPYSDSISPMQTCPWFVTADDVHYYVSTTVGVRFHPIEAVEPRVIGVGTTFGEQETYTTASYNSDAWEAAGFY